MRKPPSNRRGLFSWGIRLHALNTVLRIAVDLQLRSAPRRGHVDDELARPLLRVGTSPGSAR